MKTTVNTSLNIRGSRNKGFGLVEIMVAIVIALLLATIISEVVISSKRTYRTEQDVSRLQENARFAIHFITKDLRMAGYQGCSPTIYDHLNPLGDGYSDTLFSLDVAAGGWEYAATSPNDSYTITTTDPSGASVGNWRDYKNNPLPVSLQDRVLPGTDVLVLKRLDADTGVAVKGEPNANNASINLTGSKSGAKKYGILLITQDCMTADLFQNLSADNAGTLSRGTGSSSSPGPGNKNPNAVFPCESPPCNRKWSTAYQPGAQVMYFSVMAYFVGQGAGGGPALFRAIFDQGSEEDIEYEELVEGVENMQVLFGEDDAPPPLDGVANRYVPIDQLTDPANITNIVSIRISLLMRTINQPKDVIDTKNDYLLTGSTKIDPQNDRRLRYVATTTVKLRNRVKCEIVGC